MSGGSKRERRDRECGLTFAWRIAESSKWAGFLSLVIAGLLTSILFASVRVRVMPSPNVIDRKGATTLIPDWGDGRAWTIRADEAGPFPAKYDPTQSPDFQQAEAKAFEDLQVPPASRVRLKDLPDDHAAVVPVGTRGERVFPSQPPLEEKPPAAAPAPLAPDLVVLSKLPPNSLPVSLPDFRSEVTPAMAAANWRFTLEIGKNGAVTDLIALDGSDEAISRTIGEWLGDLRFGPGAAGAGWIGVEVGFTRKP